MEHQREDVNSTIKWCWLTCAQDLKKRGGIEIDHYPQSQTINIVYESGRIWVCREELNAPPIQVMVPILVHLQPAPLSHSRASGALMVHLCLSVTQSMKSLPCSTVWESASFSFSLPRKRGVEKIAPVKAQAQLWHFITMHGAVLHLCTAQLSFQVMPLFNICRFRFCGTVNSSISVLWSCSRDQNKAWNDIVLLKSIECLCS